MGALPVDGKKVDTRIWAYARSIEYLKELAAIPGPDPIPTTLSILDLGDTLYDWATQDPR